MPAKNREEGGEKFTFLRKKPLAYFFRLRYNNKLCEVITKFVIIAQQVKQSIRNRQVDGCL